MELACGRLAEPADLRLSRPERVRDGLGFEHFIDRVNPFEIVSDVENPGWRTGVQIMMGAFGVDLADECRGAYAALDRARRSGRRR